jgi:hypothetical protein
MSDSRSKYYDDCGDWEDLCNLADIEDVKWTVYSVEAMHAERGFKEKKLTGDKLKLYVKHALERDALAIKQKKEEEEYELYLKLKTKFE